jgi:hypothetical protein
MLDGLDPDGAAVPPATSGGSSMLIALGLAAAGSDTAGGWGGGGGATAGGGYGGALERLSAPADATVDSPSASGAGCGSVTGGGGEGFRGEDGGGVPRLDFGPLPNAGERIGEFFGSLRVGWEGLSALSRRTCDSSATDPPHMSHANKPRRRLHRRDRHAPRHAGV